MLGSLFSSIALWRFRHSSGAEIDLSRLISRFLKKGKNGAGFQYKANTLYGKSERDMDDVFFFDAPYRIILYGFKNNVSVPIACIAFIQTGPRSVCINQIQGPSYDRSEENTAARIAALSEVKWERLLVRVVCEWARKNRIESVEMISCKKSRWYRDFRHKQMFIRYDVTARRMGFKESDKEGIYKIDTNRMRLLKEAAV